MRIRYTTAEDGSPVQQAVIYTLDEHRISAGDVDPDALKIIRRLRSAGHSAYVVGGAIRDLLLGKRPKDFDVATDASPSKIRKLFRNSRVIGKRFRLVHVYFHEKIIEVSTFRSETSEVFNNVYGAIEEDVRRRDFTVNALFFCAVEQLLLDYVDGFRDLQTRTLRPLIPLERIFVEDPVRMIRAIKYASAGGLTMTGPLRRTIKRSVDLLASCPSSRMTEEVFKILQSGYARPIIEELHRYRLLQYVVPRINEQLKDKGFRRLFFSSLDRLDQQLETEEDLRRSRALAYLACDYIYTRSEYGTLERIPFKEAFAELKHYISPITPANKDVQKALVQLIRRRKRYRAEGQI
ncbi:MAG: polynucleotide adenylyltransferase PcnB [Spirochaetaceae bacterium]|nr:MAG: polynucleotide adenylyltransferase PcnB [Spirochaetaceae bacterium]